MNNLLKLQQDFLSSLIDGNSSIHSSVVNTKEAEQSERVAIYSNAYYIRLYNSLVDNFPLLFEILSESEFQNIADLYIKNYPSKTYNLQRYGDKFPLLLSKPFFPSYFKELALFDYALLHASMANDGVIINLSNFNDVANNRGDNFDLKLVSNVSLLSFEHNIDEVYSDSSCKLKSLEQKSYLVVWRNGLSCNYRTISYLEFEALQYLNSWISFESLWHYFESHNYADSLRMSMLQQWLYDEILSYR